MSQVTLGTEPPPSPQYLQNNYISIQTICQLYVLSYQITPLVGATFQSPMLYKDDLLRATRKYCPPLEEVVLPIL